MIRRVLLTTVLAFAALVAVKAGHFVLSIDPDDYNNYTPVPVKVHFLDGSISNQAIHVGCEIAAYCGKECRGISTVTKDTSRGLTRYVCSLCAYGHVNEIFRFYLYNPVTGKETPLGGTIAYDTGNGKGDLYEGRILPQDLMEGGHYATAGSLAGADYVRLMGEWDNKALDNLSRAMGDKFLGQPDFSGATLTANASQASIFQKEMAPNSMIVVPSTFDAAYRQQANVITATQTTTSGGKDTTLYTAHLLLLTDRSDFINHYTILAGTARIVRPTWVDGSYETCILPFVPMRAYRADDAAKQDEWNNFHFEKYLSHSTTEVTYSPIANSSFASDIPYLMKYTGSHTAATKVDYYFETDNVNVPIVDDVYGNDWTGCYRPHTVAAGEVIYIINFDGTMLQKAASGLIVPPFHCYFFPSSGGGSGIKGFTIGHSDETGISPVVNDKGNKDATLYDMTGRKVDKIVRSGLYIIGGTKRYITL